MSLISRIILITIAAATTAQAAVINGDLAVNSFAAYTGQTNIVLQATGNIVFSGGTLNLPALPPGAAGGLLTVQAGNDVVVNDGVTIIAGTGWSVTMAAGITDFGPDPVVAPSTGNITFLGTGSLVVTDGSISCWAGNNVTVASGVIVTTGGGDIIITALAGSMSVGSGNLPGQIGTVDGGSINISAGGNVSGNIIPHEGVVTNITAGGIITILPGGDSLNPIKGCHHGNVCPHDTRRHDGIFDDDNDIAGPNHDDAGCEHNQFGSRHFVRTPISWHRQPYRPDPAQLRRH